VLVGDGAFQMTGWNFPRARVRAEPHCDRAQQFWLRTERQIQDGAYNDVRLWHYSRLPEIFGAGRGFVVRTETELDTALEESKKWTKSFCLLDVTA